MEILNLINKIRILTETIKKEKIDESSLITAIDEFYPSKSICDEIEDDELANMYFESILILSTTIYNLALNRSLAEVLLLASLEFNNDSNIKKKIYEQLLVIEKDGQNPFNDSEYVKKFNEVVNDFFNSFHPKDTNGDEIITLYSALQSRKSDKDVYDFLSTLNNLFSYENIQQINSSKFIQLKESIIKNLISCYYVPNHTKEKLVHDFKKKFFIRLKKISISDEVLLGEINEIIYDINFDTKGWINKFDRLKSKIIGE